MRTEVKDPTHGNLEYARLDQMIAGEFANQRYAYAPVMHETGYWTIGIAVENEQGHHPVDGPRLVWERKEGVVAFCRGMNMHVGLSEEDEVNIIASTMRGSRSY